MIATYFYDKTVEFYQFENGVSPEGGRTKGIKQLKGSIKCNIHQSINQAIREQYGIKADAKLMITCSPQEDVQKGYKFNHEGHEYEVYDILTLDTHLKVICR